MVKYFCLNCGDTTVYIEERYQNLKSWEVDKQQILKCKKCNSSKIYKYNSILEKITNRIKAWIEGWEKYNNLYYSKHKLKQIRKKYLSNSR